MRRLRASPRFALKRLEELSPEQRKPFEELTRDDDFYGLLIPRPPAAATIKAVNREVAAMLIALATPSPVDDLDDDVVDLVLDGILEIEHDGAFVCGADALPLVVDTAALSDGDGGGIARLSLDALRYAEDLADDDAETLTRALYLYNRIPAARFWTARFPDREAVLAHLGLASTIASAWRVLPPAQANDWINFHAHDRRAVRRGAATYKLYVSPRPENVRDAFEAVVRVLAGRNVDFKIGPDAGGLLRPDKMVAYFGERAELDDVAAALRARLAGCPAHGVPFTAGLGDDGLLSWGLDPPESERALSWLGRESWRLWLATKLGAALSFAKTSSRGAVEPWRFAIERVRRLGVDIERWTPADTLWSAA